MDRLARDAATNAKAIDTILARNHEQAVAFGFKGTPSFIVGKYRVPGVLSAQVGENVHLQWSGEQAHLFDRASGARVG